MIKLLFSNQQCIKHSLKIRYTVLRNLGYDQGHINDYKYIHKLLLNYSNYSKTTINIEKLITVPVEKYEKNIKNVKMKPPEVNKKISVFYHMMECLENCEKLGHISFVNIKPLIKRFHELSDDELLEVLLTLISLQSLQSGDLSKADFSVFRNLARECIRRSKWWNENQLLLVADICFALGGVFCTIFHPYVLMILHSKPKSLNHYQLTQSFFYVGIIRNYNFKNQQSDIEEQILSAFKLFEIEELSIIALGFFKTQNKIKNIDLLMEITDFVIHHKQSLSDFSLNCFLKILQFSFDGRNPLHAKLCLALWEEMRSEIKNRNLYILVRLAAIGNNLNIYDDKLVTEIIDHLVPRIKESRLKELDRICFVVMNSRVKLTNFQHFIQSVENELQSPERADEIENYFYSFVACIYYLACMGYYTTQISKALKQSHILQGKNEKRSHTSSARDRQLYELYIMLQIDSPEKLCEFQASEDYLLSLRKTFLPNIPTKTRSSTLQESHFMELYGILLKMMGKQRLEISFILPILSLPVILFCIDGNGNLVDFPHELFDSSKDIKRACISNESLTWHAVVLANQSAFIYNTDLLRGSIFSHIRLIENLGYQVVLVNNKLLGLSEEQKANQIFRCFDKVVNKQWIKKMSDSIQVKKKIR